MVTYSDTMTLLLCFFVIIVSFSEVKKDQRFQAVMESIRRAFGGYEGGYGLMPIPDLPTNSLLAKLVELEIPKYSDKEGDSDEEGIHGKRFRVTNVRDGVEVVVGGHITFERFSATLKAEGRELIAKTADRLRGYNTRILVRGHATREALPSDCVYQDKRDLAFARAKAVANELVASGVRGERLVLVAVGDAEPLLRQAYSEERLALNRRVELLVTEELVDDYAGSNLKESEKENSDGR